MDHALLNLRLSFLAGGSIRKPDRKRERKNHWNFFTRRTMEVSPKHIQIFIQFYVRSCLRVSTKSSNIMKSYVLGSWRKENCCIESYFLFFLLISVQLHKLPNQNIPILCLLLLIHLFYPLVVNNIWFPLRVFDRKFFFSRTPLGNNMDIVIWDIERPS